MTSNFYTHRVIFPNLLALYFMPTLKAVYLATLWSDMYVWIHQCNANFYLKRSYSDFMKIVYKNNMYTFLDHLVIL